MLTGWNAKYTLATVAMLLVFALVVVFFLQRGNDDDSPEASPTPTPVVTTATAAATEPQKTEVPFVVAPGRVGAAKVGMTKSQAVATGLFNTNVDHGADDCRGVVPLEWKTSISSALDVLLEGDDSIAAIGISSGTDGPKTAEDIGVGTSFGKVLAAYPNLSPVVSAGFDQSGAFLSEGNAWLGFLFNEKPDAITENSKIVFMEADDEKPELIRDGC